MTINEATVHNIYRKFVEIAFQDAAPDKAHYLVKGGGGSVNFTVSGAICDIIQDGGHESLSKIVRWEHILDIFEKNDPNHYWIDFWKAICDCARNTIDEGLLEFWRDILVISISPKDIDRTNEVKAVLLAALFSRMSAKPKSFSE